MNRLVDSVKSRRGSKLHNSLPVSGSSAITRENGVVTYITPSITNGVDSKAERVGQRVPSLTSVVWKIHAGRNFDTLSRLISFMDEYFPPPASPAYHGHSWAFSGIGSKKKIPARYRNRID